MAVRREQGYKPLDRMHPLAQGIMKGWKKNSPSDSLILSPDLELMGRMPVNELLGSFMIRNYLTFLKEALDGKLPGFGNTIITPKQPSQQILEAFRTAEYGHQDYTVIILDATAFECGGTLIIDFEVGSGKAHGQFHLLDADTKLIFDSEHKYPTWQLFDRSINTVWGDPCETMQIIHRFERGQLFKLVVLVATGWTSDDMGSINAFHAQISVEEH